MYILIFKKKNLDSIEVLANFFSLLDSWKECDYILGVKNFVETQNDLKYMVTTLPHYKTLIHNNPTVSFRLDTYLFVFSTHHFNFLVKVMKTSNQMGNYDN